MSKLIWKTVKVKVRDLKKAEFNPRRITEQSKKHLLESLNKFDLVDIPVVNKDWNVISGNQRIDALIISGRSDEEIDVRIPNRQLSEKEEKEYMLIANTHAGVFDAELIEVHFSDIGIDFDFKSVKGKKAKTEKLEDISSFKDKTVMKLSFTNETALRVKEALNKLKITPESIILNHLFGE